MSMKNIRRSNNLEFFFTLERIDELKKDLKVMKDTVDADKKVIDVLKKKLKVMEDTVDAGKKGIEELKFKVMSSIKAAYLISKYFSAALSVPWVKKNEEIARDMIFKLIPQEPHFKPLEKFPTSLKGFRVVLDLEFVNLYQKLSVETVRHVEFFDHVEEYSSQLTFLEEHGYDVGKLHDRLDELKKDLKVIEDTVDADKKVIDMLKKKLKVMEDTVDTGKKEIEELKFKVMNSIKATYLISKYFSAALSAPWVKKEGEIQEN
ncbi:DUF724 domain-containing protein 5-like [Papaver somniferum]|uniref:DUF724 domain-containing protein 5-like n=1 Tax=Papaver somniferum TaxID=3469 RepID=UPI000E7005D0|nr:DUF724 domain-containing protein 5-like [Papaver somniferum]